MTAKTNVKPGPLGGKVPDVDPETIRRLLSGIPLGASQTIILAQGPQVVAHRGALKPIEAADVAIYIANSWRDSGQYLRIQFMQLPLLSAGRLLLTYALRDGYRLILVDHQEAGFDQLRNLGSQLLSVLEVAGLSR